MERQDRLFPLPQVINWLDFSKQSSQAAAQLGGRAWEGLPTPTPQHPPTKGLASAPPNAKATRPFSLCPRVSLHQTPSIQVRKAQAPEGTKGP
jgi:hypothetical protein